MGVNKEWKWEEKQQVAFNTLKRLFTEQLLLVAPDMDKKFQIKSDASDCAIGGVLLMLCDDEKWRPVAYLSKSLNLMERHSEASGSTRIQHHTSCVQRDVQDGPHNTNN